MRKLPLPDWDAVHEAELKVKRRWLRELTTEEAWRQFEALYRFALALAPEEHPRLRMAQMQELARQRQDIERLETWRQRGLDR